jgi:hypothetical protein
LFNVSCHLDGRYGLRLYLNDAVRTALANPEPNVSLHLGWRRAGREKLFEQFTTLPRRPLWKLFPAYDPQDRLTDWIVWIWKTSHYHTSTHGDSMIGWHVNNPDLDGTPRFHRAEKFRDVFHRPLVVVPLLVNRDYPAALKRALGENPQPISFGTLEPPPLTVTAADPVAKDAVTVRVELRQRGTNPDLMPERIELWVNDWRFKTWDARPDGLDEPVAIPADKLRAGENTVTVQTFNRLGGRGEAQTAVRNPKRPGKPRLLGVSIGINDYAGSGKSPDGSRLFGNLASARKDAESIRTTFQEFSGADRFFPDAHVAFLSDAKAKRQAILAALDDLAKRSGPDDRVVIFLAGHGDYVKTRNRSGKPEDVFVFCCPDYDPGRYNQTGVTAAELFDKLAAIPGRKLVLVDACHSGQAAAANVVRALVPTGQGPTVIAACDQTERSYEDPTVGNGLFTFAVLEALGRKFEDADANHDTALGPDEIYDYVRDRVPQLLKQVGKPADVQNPICFPRNPTPYTVVRKDPN